MFLLNSKDWILLQNSFIVMVGREGDVVDTLGKGHS